MPRQYVACNSQLCTGCQLCEFVCSSGKHGVANLELSRIRVSHPLPAVVKSVSCQLCPDAPCVEVCPRKALTIDQETGIILLDKALCTGCGWCIEACQYGAVALDPSSKSVVICDLCREQEGGPRCVAYCPREALALTPVPEASAS